MVLGVTAIAYETVTSPEGMRSPHSRAYRPNGRELLTRYVPALFRRGPPRVSVQQKLDVPRPLPANTSAAALNSLPLTALQRRFEHADQPAAGRFDGENSNFGTVTIDDQIYQELTKTMTSLNAQAEGVHAAAAFAKYPTN
jgi:hypothetical protein